jgi:hypothetical protein
MITKRPAVSASSRATLAFIYHAAAGGFTDGAISLDVPAGWSAPSTTPGTDGYVTSTSGTLSVAGQTITVAGLSLQGGAVTLTYGSKVGGGSGALVPPATGPATWTAKQKSSSGGTLTPLSSSPQVTVYAPDGSGTLSTPTTTVAHGSSGNRITFTYTAAAGGMSGGTLSVGVPPGWSAPSTSSADPGYTTASAPAVAVSGQRIVLSGVTLAGGSTLTIRYGRAPGPGATAPSRVGLQTWRTAERSTPGGTSAPLAASPVIATS